MDAAIQNDKIVLLLYADKQRDRGWLQPEGGAQEILGSAFGVAVSDLAKSERPQFALIGKRDSTADGELLNSRCYSSRLCGTNAYLIPGANNKIKIFQIASNSGSFSNHYGHENDGQQLADRFILTPDRYNIIACGGNPFVLNAITLEPLTLESATQCAEILCGFWTNKLSLVQISAIGDDLKSIAVQTKSGAGWHQFNTWNLQQSNDARIIKIDGDLLRLESIQLVNNKVWVLCSTAIGGIGPASHREAILVDEDGVALGKTKMFGEKPVVDSDFDRVVFLKQDSGCLHIKVWHPKLNREEAFDVNLSRVFSNLYSVWNK